VALTVSAAGGGDVAVSSTGTDGAFALALPAPGAYVLHANLAGFADASRDVTLAGEGCQATLEVELVLRSRVPAASVAPPPPAAPPPAASGSRRPGGASRDRGNGGPAGRFRALGVVPGAGAAPDREAGAEGLDPASQSLLPPGFSPDAPTESVATQGAQGQTVDSLLFRDRQALLDEVGGDLDALAQRMRQGGFGGGMGPGEGPPGGPGGFGPGGFGGGGFGPGGGFGGFAGRGGARANRLQGSVFYNFGGSALDASPYPLNGPQQKADYFQQRFGATFGGPLKVPGLYDGTSRTSFFLSYMGNHSRSPLDLYSTVPTEAEREGDLSDRGDTIYDPLTGEPFPGNQIPASRIDPSASSLLALVPLPNQPGTGQNFRYTTATANSTDQFTFRLTQSFGAAPAEGPNRRVPPAGGGGGFGGGRWGVGRRPTLTVGLTYRTSSSNDATGFPTLAGTTHQTAWDVPVGFFFSSGRVSHQLRFDFNRSEATSSNLYAYTRDVAGEAGIGGVATDPFDWGAPNLSFSSFTSLRDPNPSTRVDQRISVSDALTATLGHHTLRLGGQFRYQSRDARTDSNARGSYVFTGLYTAGIADGSPMPGTGLDLADFLLGYPQQATVQYGPGLVSFHAPSWSLFLQDDWRLRSNLTLNLGLRYEYVAPFTEPNGHLVNLDATPDFSAVAPVLAGQAGAYTGAFPGSLVYADTNNLAPRVGLAWKIDTKTTLRAGYGTSYNLGAYGPIAQSLAGQPPFAVSDTALGSLETPLVLSDAFARTDPTATKNSYGIDKNYQLGKVQIWSLDLQREVAGVWVFAIGYAGTRGTDLDLERAPNRGPVGPRLPDVQPFLWQSSEATSIMHSLTVRARRRLAHGVGVGVSYIFSKSIDDASSIGGGAMVVAQNDLDLAAERGRSSFDRRHRLAADYVVELPFGPGRRWLEKGFGSALLGGWTWNGTVTVQSGAPFTARVLGDYADVSRGVNGTLRADVTGEAVALADPDPALWFNPGAFVAPPLGAFGDAGRNTVTGPGAALVNMGLTRNVPLGGTRVLSIRVQANNVFNTPQFTAIDTVVNSPTFGRVIATGPMRTIQVQMRFRL
jgi:outer membrane receptor protein involved in Fe transport